MICLVLLIVDSFSKWPEAFPLRTQEAKEIARVLYSEIFTRYGAPDAIVSDRGQNFMSKLVTAVCEIFQVTRKFTSSYHPQTNSTCERMNSTIAQCLRAYVDKEQKNWPESLPGIMMALRMSPSTQASNMSPYRLVFGKEMTLPFDTSLIPRENLSSEAKTHVADLMHRLETARELATKNVQKAREHQKEQYDKKSEEPNFRIGDLVLLHSTRVPQGLSPKLHPPWDGPFYIAAIGPNNTFILRRCSTHKQLKSPIHANRLKIYHNPDFRQSLNPPPVNHPIDDSHKPSNDEDNDDEQVAGNQNQDRNEQRTTEPQVNEPGGPEQAQQQLNPNGHDRSQNETTQDGTGNQQPEANDAVPSNNNATQNHQSNDTSTQQAQPQYYVEKLLHFKYKKAKRYFESNGRAIAIERGNQKKTSQHILFDNSISQKHKRVESARLNQA